MTTEQMAAAQEMIVQFEGIYFTGCFSEGTIKSDLNYRPEKRQFYIKDFDDTEETINLILSLLQKAYPNHALIPRFERCKNQIVKLRNLVRNF